MSGFLPKLTLAVFDSPLWRNVCAATPLTRLEIPRSCSSMKCIISPGAICSTRSANNARKCFRAFARDVIFSIHPRKPRYWRSLRSRHDPKFQYQNSGNYQEVTILPTTKTVVDVGGDKRVGLIAAILRNATLTSKAYFSTCPKL